MGVNAAVVGILIAAFYDPIWTSSILAPIDFAFAAILFSLLVFWKLPSMDNRNHRCIRWHTHFIYFK